MTRSAFAALITAATLAVTDVKAVQQETKPLVVVPAIGTRITVKSEKYNGLYQVIDFNGKVRLQKVSADGSRLLNGKTFSIEATELAKITQ